MGVWPGLDSGQYEAANALGFSYWKAQRLIIMPQALKISIPGIVSNFIGVLKDTTLVSVIGLFDPLGLTTVVLADMRLEWSLLGNQYVFVALCFFVFCFSMSRYSMYLERKLRKEKLEETHLMAISIEEKNRLGQKCWHLNDHAIAISEMNKWFGTFHVLRDINLKC